MRAVTILRHAVVLVSLRATDWPLGAAEPGRTDPRDALALRAVIEKIDKSYVDASRVDSRKMLWAAVRALDREIPEVILDSSPGGEALTLQVAGAVRTFPIASVRTF